MTVVADGDDDYVLGEDIHVFCPSFHPHVSFLCRAEIGILLKTVRSQTLTRRLGEHPLVEHCGENVHARRFFVVPHVLVEVGQVEVDDDVIEEDFLLKSLVVLEGDGDGGALAERELA